MDKTAKTFLLSNIPQTEVEWVIVYAWIVVHKLGRVKLKEHFSALSRSWIEEWRLGNVIEWVSGEFQPSLAKRGDTLFVIKLMTEFQNWFNYQPGDDSFPQQTILKRLLREPEIQNYLHVNRFQEILYFNAERFESFCKWLLNIAVIQNLAMDNHSKVIEVVEMINTWLRISNEEKYQVSKLLEKLGK